MARQNARFTLLFEQIANRDAGDFASGAAGRRTRNVRLQRAGHGFAEANRRVDIGEQFVGIGSVQIRRLGSVHHRTTAHRNEAVELAVLRKFRGGHKRVAGRLNRAFPINFHRATDRFERAFDGRNVGQVTHCFVGKEANALHAQSARVRARFTQAARPEGEVIDLDGKGGIALVTLQAFEPVVATARVHHIPLNDELGES